MRKAVRTSQTELVIPERPHAIPVTRAESADAEPENRFLKRDQPRESDG